jgi:hypothetical protein
MPDTPAPGPIDERTALDELERFRQGIARERARRGHTTDEFESLVRSLKAPVPPSVPARPSEPSRAYIPEQPPEWEWPREPQPVPLADPRPPSHAPVRDAAGPPSVGELLEAYDNAPASIGRGQVVVRLLALVIIAALMAWALWPAAPVPSPGAGDDRVTSTPPPPATETAPAAPATAPGAAAEPPAATPPATQPATGTELTTSRNVWVRVIADGERVLEREVAAGSRIPITAQKTIVIRTGDAEAVRLTIAGQDQGALGRAGEVVTRTFTVPGGQAP